MRYTYRGIIAETWTALFLPKGASREIVDKLVEVTQAAMETPAIRTRMHEIGVTKDRQTPEYLVKYVSEEIARWEASIKAAGLQVD